MWTAATQLSLTSIRSDSFSACRVTVTFCFHNRGCSLASFRVAKVLWNAVNGGVKSGLWRENLCISMYVCVCCMHVYSNVDGAERANYEKHSLLRA